MNSRNNLLENILNKASKTWEDTLANITCLPSPDEFGQVKLSYHELRKLLDERRKLAWASGVCDAIARMKR